METVTLLEHHQVSETAIIKKLLLAIGDMTEATAKYQQMLKDRIRPDDEMDLKEAGEYQTRAHANFRYARSLAHAKGII